jgi:hypothetical protein
MRTILLLSVVMEEGNGAWNQRDAYIALTSPLVRKKPVDEMTRLRGYLQGGMIGEMGEAGPHAVNL